MTGQLSTRPRCPCCGALIDGFSGITDAEATPEPGDVGVCLYCCEVHVYDGEPVAVRKPTPQESLAFAADPSVAEAVRIAHAARQQGGFERRGRLQ